MRYSSWLGRKPSYPERISTIVHICHVKTGSTWLDSVWRQLFGPHVAPRGKAAVAEVFPGNRFYSGLFMTRDEFMAHPELHDTKRFIVIRDLRDTLISLYFSLRFSHPLDDFVAEQRDRLNGMSQEEGLVYLARGYLRKPSRIQLSWFGQNEIVLRYEELIANDEALLRDLLIDRFELPITPSQLQEAVAANRFAKRFKRPLGSEDPRSHGRQGAPGNWRVHFTPAVAKEFCEVFGDVLLATGYEMDHRWAHPAVPA